MDHAFVEHAENDVNRDHRGGDQQRLVGQRGLKGLSRALKAALDRRGQTDLVAGNLNAANRVTERQSRRKIEGQSNRRKLALMGYH